MEDVEGQINNIARFSAPSDSTTISSPRCKKSRASPPMLNIQDPGDFVGTIETCKDETNATITLSKNLITVKSVLFGGSVLFNFRYRCVPTLSVYKATTLTVPLKVLRTELQKFKKSLIITLDDKFENLTLKALNKNQQIIQQSVIKSLHDEEEIPELGDNLPFDSLVTFKASSLFDAVPKTIEEKLNVIVNPKSGRKVEMITEDDCSISSTFLYPDTGSIKSHYQCYFDKNIALMLRQNMAMTVKLCMGEDLPLKAIYEFKNARLILFLAPMVNE